MVRLLAGVAICGVLIPPPAVGLEFPYRAYINADDVYVRSGPGQSYYPTDKLKIGQEVEVYRHDPGGWYAIRPPEGSFSWVSGRYLAAGVENLAVVTEDRVAARVGSRFSDIRDVIQVRLHKAEVVEVLDAKQIGTGTGRTTWYKIAPPSGEFRWVAGRYVDPDYPHSGLRKTHAAENRTPPADAPDMDHATHSRPVASSTGRPPAEEPSVIVVPSSPAAVPRPSESFAPVFSPQTARGMTPEEYQSELEEMDLELSAMVSEEPTVWTFDDLRPRCEELLATAETAVERGRARVLLNKITRFEDIKRRYDAISRTRAANERSNRQLAAMRRENSQYELPPELEERFDGVGELREVASSKPGAPRYALVDGFDQVRCYVSPSPGVNLRRYLGRRIGINGNRAYILDQQTHHVMAKHVSVLDGRRLR